jgi:DNA-binding CsgD family transcriptional regulator
MSRVRLRTRPPTDRLSGRQAQVLRLCATGMSDRQVAARLGVTWRTVNGYMALARGKMDADTTVGAFWEAVRRGEVECHCRAAGG